ncbi:aspartic peptidase domain-containing protein [Tirmania nivea]|nr:aspartic peptidase domain-containing protein [Tirmania nivea]
MWSSSPSLRPRLSLTILLGTASIASAQTIWMQFAPVSPALNSTDDFLMPFTLGSNMQVVNLVPSLTQTETSIIGPKACTPPGQKAPKDKCILYRGGAFDESKSTSFNAGTDKFNYKNPTFGTYSNGPMGKDTVYLDGNLEVNDYQFAVIESTNMTSGMLGLGKDSAFLKRLYDDGKIASRSFGLHVGIDIWNHPWPVLNPTFDESGNRPTTKDDLNTGNGKRAVGTHKSFIRQETDENRLPVRESHKFPGSLTLGGYDKTKISNKTKPINVPIADDGSLRLSLTRIVARNIYADSPFDLISKPLSVVIDADTPHMYFPRNISREIGWVFSAVYGVPGDDFFYTYLAGGERDLGNLTMTFTAPDGKGDEIDIVIPPTVWYQPVGYMRNFELVGNDEYNYYAPMREWEQDPKSTQIILGRSFLKAAHLFVNYDTNNFQLAQVAYTNSTKDIVTVAAGQDAPSDNPNTGNSNRGSNTVPQDGGGHMNIPIPILVGALVGGVVLIVALVLILFCLKKRRDRENAKQHQQLEDRPNTGISDLPIGGRRELDGDNVAMMELNRPTTAVSHAESHAELPVKVVKSTPPELPSTNVYNKAELGAPATAYVELGTKPDYHEIPSNTVSPTTPQQAHTPVSPNPTMYRPPSQPPPISTPSTPGYPSYNYQHQQCPPPPGPQATWQQYPPPPGPPPPNMFPAGYVPPPPPPNPPSPGSPYAYIPHQYPAQVYQPHAVQRATLHEMA